MVFIRPLVVAANWYGAAPKAPKNPFPNTLSEFSTLQFTAPMLTPYLSRPDGPLLLWSVFP